MFLNIRQSVIKKFNRRAKGGSLKRAGKKEGVRGRNFCLPVVFPVKCAQTPIPRRPPTFGRRGKDGISAPACVAPFQRTLAQIVGQFSKNLWRLASRTFKMSPNFVIEPLPIRKLRFLRGFLPRNLQAASHFLAGELKVRLRKAQNSAAMVKLLYHCAQQPIFCFAPSAQLPNFQKESDNFPRIARLCPKAITTKNL